MGLVLYFVRILLAAVFAIAGIAKSANLANSRKAVADFGVPTWLAQPGGNLLPAIELAVAAFLLLGSSAWWAALVALILLLVFVVAIILNLVHGRHPDCNCFGHIKSKPIGWITVIRNATLACGATLVVIAGPARSSTNVVSGVAGALDLSSTVLLATLMALVVVAAETSFLWHLFRQNGRLLVRMDEIERRLEGGRSSVAPQGLPIGDAAPLFELAASAGGALGLQALRQSGTAILLVFTDPHCQPCAALLPTIAQWQQEYAAWLTVVVIGRGDQDANRALVERHGLNNVLVQRDNEVAEAYKVVATPAGVFLRPDGTIGTAVALGREAIVALLQTLDKEKLTISSARRDLDTDPGIGFTYGTAIR